MSEHSVVGDIFRPAEQLGKKLLPLALILLPLLVLLPGLGAFPFPDINAKFSDFAISHYPNAVYLQDALIHWHVPPLWSPTILSGYPFFADPLSGLWYPPGWLALLMPLPFGLNLLAWLHLLFGGVGMYAFLKTERLGPMASVFGALAFTAMPKLYAHYSAGHLTLVYALAWTPWLLLRANHVFSRLSDQGKSAAFELVDGPLAGLLALTWLADVRWAALATMLVWGYLLTRPLPGHVRRMKNLSRRRAVEMRLTAAFSMGINTLLGGLLAAPLLFPLLEYTRLSTRVHLSAGDNLLYSLAPDRLLGLIYPDFGGFSEWIAYNGAAVILLSLLALSWRVVRRKNRFWLVVLAASLLYALGSYLPGMIYVSHLPVLNLLRVPPRSLFLTGISLEVLAAHTVDRLLAGIPPLERRSASLTLAGWVSFCLLIGASVGLLAHRLMLSMAWGAGMTFVFARWVGGRLSGKQPARFWFAGLVVLSLVDWWAVDASLLSPHQVQQTLSQGAQGAAFLSEEEGLFRVYSPSYSLPQQTAAVNHLQLVDG